jgi:hypothetical protein
MSEWLTPAGIGLLFAIASAIAGVWYRLADRINQLREELSNYKLEVAKEYASTTHLKEVEIRLVTAVESLTQRIDRLIDRMDRREER